MGAAMTEPNGAVKVSASAEGAPEDELLPRRITVTVGMRKPSVMMACRWSECRLAPESVPCGAARWTRTESVQTDE